MNPLNEEFGRLVRAARNREGLTQSQVAERVGLSRTSVTNIEKGRQTVLLHQIFLFASALGMAPQDLLPMGATESEDRLPERAVRAMPKDEQDRAFVTRVIQRSNEDQKGTQAGTG
jgi:transcriptional regulator with XRE-family HTH domain